MNVTLPSNQSYVNILLRNTWKKLLAMSLDPPKNIGDATSANYYNFHDFRISLSNPPDKGPGLRYTNIYLDKQFYLVDYGTCSIEPILTDA